MSHFILHGEQIPEPTDCFAVPGDSHIIDMVHPLTGNTVIRGKSLEEIRLEPGYELAERMPIDQFCEQKARKQDTPIEWYPITEEQYHYWFECLPPAAYGRQAFLVGEPSDHHAQTGAPRFQACKRVNGQFLASSRPLTIKEFKEMSA